MKRSALVAGLFAHTAASACTLVLHDYADTVFRGGPLHTVDSTQPQATAKAADLVLLDRDLFAIPPEQISKAHVPLTLLDRHDVYRDAILR